MSQSPVDDFSEQASLSYKQGWRALNRLLHEDRSFSGHERNCAFLNTGGDSARFADVSAITGFDFPDDGRGLATADWDFDGDLDVWITNRTAPRIRLLRNNTTNPEHFVAFKLAGDGIATNRDAIGARLELHLSGTSSPVRIRTLRGGEGFISQSSNWIHFGLGDAGEISKLVVRWPGATTAQEFSGIKSGEFYKLAQGKADAIRFVPPSNRRDLIAAPQVPQALTELARIIVPAGLPAPKLTTDQDKPIPLNTERPTLINLWSSTCASCLVELTEWSAHKDELEAAGVEVITLGTDHLAENSDPAAALATLAKTRSTFKNYRISEASLQSLDELQRAVLDRWIPMPVPASFLIKPDGELVAIYKGPVSPTQLLQDIPLASADAKTRRQAALPFPGQWVGSPTPADPKRVASLMLDHNRLDAAIGYLDVASEFLEVRASDENQKRALGDLYFMAGTLTGLKPESQKQATDLLVRARDLIPSDLRIRTELGRRYLAGNNLQGALSEFVAASEIAPSDTGLRQDIGLLHFRLGNYPQAKDYFSPIVAANPDNGLAQYHLANTEIHLGNVPAAITGYRNTLRSAPKLFDAANNLAWILASHPNEKLRSPEEALALAQRLCQLSNDKNPQFLDTLGVAQANAGNFRDAIASAKKAIALHPPENQQAVAAIAERVKLYESGTPYREAAWQ